MNSHYGQHILLDYTHWSYSGEDDAQAMLEILLQAARTAGARVVHTCCERFDGSVSPPGFTAVVLLDESHISAHCYSTRGLVAIDVFTCGDTDALAIVKLIQVGLSKRVPGIRLYRQQNIDRFVDSEGD